MKLYFILSYEFFKVGLFSFGGGYATLPFLFLLGQKYGFYTPKELAEMLAVSAITPGPVGVNVATFAGFKAAGFFGSLCATLSEILPSLIIVVGVSKLLSKFKENFYVKSALYALKPATCAMIGGIGVRLFRESVLETSAIALFLLMLLISFKFKKDPLFYLAFGAAMGIATKTFLS